MDPISYEFKLQAIKEKACAGEADLSVMERAHGIGIMRHMPEAQVIKS